MCRSSPAAYAKSRILTYVVVRFAVVLILGPAPWVAVGGANAGVVGDSGTGEFSIMFVMLMLVIFWN
jgi:hypothetical protein